MDFKFWLKAFEERIYELLNLSEEQRAEFKASFNKRYKWVERLE